MLLKNLFRFIGAWTYIIRKYNGIGNQVSELNDGINSTGFFVLEPDAITTLYKLTRFKKVWFICRIQAWLQVFVEGPEILKFLTFMTDKVPDTCEDATSLTGTHYDGECSSVTWSADDVVKKNRVTDRILSLSDSKIFSLFGQNYACFEGLNNNPNGVFNVLVM